MECIAVINQKGGVGKTSTAVNLGAGLGERGKRVLLVDLDPQGHLTTHFGLDESAPGKSIYEVLTSNLPLADAIHSYSSVIDIVPSNVDLAAAETELVSVLGREVILRDALSAGEWPYDVVLFDCPPSLGILSLNALCAANRVLIPVQPHFLAMQGTGKLFETISLVNQRINPRLAVLGIVMCLFDAGTRLSFEVVGEISRYLESDRDSTMPWHAARIFETRIRRNVKLAECPSFGQSIFEYAPRSNGAIDYLALADEVIAVLEGRIGPTESFSNADDEAASAAATAGDEVGCCDEALQEDAGGADTAASNELEDVPAAVTQSEDSCDVKAAPKPDDSPTPAKSDGGDEASIGEVHRAPADEVAFGAGDAPPMRKPPSVSRQAS